jgi:hypothetical protein
VTSMKVNNPTVKLGSQIKKTFNAANKYRESVAQSAMAPPFGGISSKVQQIKPTPTDVSSHAIKTSHPPVNTPLQVPALSEIQSDVPLARSHVGRPAKVWSVQGALDSHAAVKRRAPQGVEDDTLCDEPVAQRTHPDNVPGQLPQAVGGARGGANGKFDEGFKDIRPKKRRRVLNEGGEPAQDPQGTETKTTSATSIPPGTSQHTADTILPSKDTPEESSAAIRRQPAAAFQKHTAEHSGMLQARRAHWSTCSMEAWLTGGQGGRGSRI